MSSSNNRFLSQLTEEPEIQSSEKSSSNRFLSQIEGLDITPKESLRKNITRTALQPALGVAKKATWPLDLLKFMIESGTKEDFRRIEKLNPNIKQEELEKGLQEATKYFPTQKLAEEELEKYTGLPLEAKTKLQKMLRLGSEAASFRPGGFIKKGTAAVVAPAVSETGKKLGLPESLSDFLGLTVSGVAPAPSMSKISKPSGMPIRRYESIKEPIKITEARTKAITEAVEKDFKTVGEKILSENKTYSELKENPNLKNEIIDMFEDVEELSTNIKEPLNTAEIQKAFQKRLRSRESKGYMSSEFERSFNKNAAELNNRFGVKEPVETSSILLDKYGNPIVTPPKEPIGKSITATQVVEQFRKNNSELKELFEPTKSTAVNRAKKESLLEHNRAIEDIIREKYPNTEFSRLFEKSNNYWSDLMDIEKVDEFINSIFEGKINYKKATKLLTEKHIAQPFSRLLGKKGYKAFQTLTKDLLSTEKPMRYLERASNAGFKDLATIGGEYVFNPTVAKVHILSKMGQRAYQMLLDKPQYAITWKNALSDLKKGKFLEAEKEFKELDKAIKSQKTLP